MVGVKKTLTTKKKCDNDITNDGNEHILISKREVVNVLRFLHGLERKIQEVLDEAVKK
jgi:hypothetical protein